MSLRSLILVVVPLLAVMACDDEFSPKSEFNEQIVVLAVLDPSSEVQIVRLAKSYDADLGEPLIPLTDSEVHEAEVLLRGPGGTHIFQDTLYSTSDGPFRVWSSRDVHLKPEQFYRLEVTVPGFDKVTSESTIPSKIFVRGTEQTPEEGKGYVVVHTGIALPRIEPHGYYFRLYVRIVKIVEGVEVDLRGEVPIGLNPGTGEWEYSGLNKKKEQRFLKEIIEHVHDGLIGEDDSLMIEQFVLYGCAFEKQFYNYYKIVRGFDDPVSIRLDDPDISYIEGGLGVFGMMMPDSSAVPYYRYMR